MLALTSSISAIHQIEFLSFVGFILSRSFAFEFLKSKYDGINKRLVLVETGSYTSISSEAREFSTRPEVHIYTKASAVIVKSLAHRIIMNFIINFTKQQPVKMRMFDNKQNAINWLLSL